MKRRWAFFKDHSGGAWSVVLVEETSDPGVGEVVEALLYRTQAECRDFANSLIGPLGEPVYQNFTFQ